MSREEYWESCYGKGSQKRPVVKCDKLTMRTIETYESASEADRRNGLKKGTVANCCRLKKVGFDDFVWRFEDEYDQGESFEGCHNRPIVLRDVETGETYVFGSSRKAGDALKIPGVAIRTAIDTRQPLLGKYEANFAR